MKAEILKDYGLIKKGSIFYIFEIKENRCTLLIESKKVDFGLSEIKIILNSENDFFECGREIQYHFKNFVMRDSEIQKEIKNLKFPLSKKLMTKCVHTFLYS